MKNDQEFLESHFADYTHQEQDHSDLLELDPSACHPIIVQTAIYVGLIQSQANSSQLPESEILYFSEGFVSVDAKNWSANKRITLTASYIMSIPLHRVQKIKATLNLNLPPNHKAIKIEDYQERSIFLSFHENIFDFWFVKMTWVKLRSMKSFRGEYEPFEGRQCKGKIFKKSEILGEWEARFVVINSRGLLSYRNEKENPTLEIDSTSELWTRFELLGKGVYLVVKMKYGIIKEEFAIPFEQGFRWLESMLTILKVPKS